MGEFAGYALQECLEAEEDRDLFRDGKMSQQEAYDRGIVDHYGAMHGPITYRIERRDPRCNRCGSQDVRWRQQGGKWVLFSLTPGQVHTCEIDASEFGAVAE